MSVSGISKVRLDESLDSKWVMWGHLPHDTEWTLESYYQISTVATLRDAIALSENLPSELATNCMLFIMREGISPTWEDDKNRDGGSFSYKLHNRVVNKAWRELSYKIYGETVVGKSSSAKVNGITVSPKKNFCIVKVWVADAKETDPTSLNISAPDFDPRTCIFKKHNPSKG